MVCMYKALIMQLHGWDPPTVLFMLLSLAELNPVHFVWNLVLFEYPPYR